ncbi:ribonuclease E [Candidatus Kinetoplastibacterium blastocrithidii TCC012E]|uniref:Ribonuclease E n=1 Tax=Candidatus Kinetoplastidibacterium blastocrithidiae TCC012E TaxID=1208922 RepID=M1LBS1_9PROT|nr:Rne/Rng family ribonuclease [Candidatus Kinetoplastibacterium blastocrithidii]AFZ83773.1 ribonuclease E [Candidatus Kinetoplastibacterium blastocrithidii (ex Strigomonas culicis)]AGF49898.1 ribonuclease E [Candidatus Kinetoplastibacterium blastocrithidii TCC012E]
MKRMLFNAMHQEELRVAIVDGQKLIDIDIETAGREQRKGNIYKGTITRVEPGLEACFINYGEEKHGFLPFKEITKNYFKEGIDIKGARIQDVITEGLELIVQVEKEERGNKGAALTTFISLAGRYLVLMPNNPRGGGVSRRIEGEERQELRETMEQLNIPAGMSIIARTAGIGRTLNELQWDLSYLLQLWNAIYKASTENKSPVLIYLESSLVIRAIRDYFSPNISEILIDNDDIVKQATAFMSIVMPDNVQRVKHYQSDVPLFSRFQIEHQIETAYSRMIQLPSGGSIVIDHTEALVAIDVNSARSTRGADIEETALQTNQEAADEVARQLRLRDLGGLIVIDFIDMDDAKNQRSVEQRLREALRVDRARVQMGKISKFGLVELSRQRLRPALNEDSHKICPRCTGTGVIRDTESSALQILRLIQEEAMKEGTYIIHAQVPVDVATYLLNEKRNDINNIESQQKIKLILIPNKYLETPNYNIERLKQDDQKLEENRTSFRLIDTPINNMIVNGAELEDKIRPEAIVKTATPSQPAPIPTTNKPVNNIKTNNIFKKIISWIWKKNTKNNDNIDSISKTENNRIIKSERKYKYKNKQQNKISNNRKHISDNYTNDVSNKAESQTTYINKQLDIINDDKSIGLATNKKNKRNNFNDQIVVTNDEKSSKQIMHDNILTSSTPDSSISEKGERKYVNRRRHNNKKNRDTENSFVKNTEKIENSFTSNLNTNGEEDKNSKENKIINNSENNIEKIIDNDSQLLKSKLSNISLDKTGASKNISVNQVIDFGMLKMVETNINLPNKLEESKTSIKIERKPYVSDYDKENKSKTLIQVETKK